MPKGDREYTEREIAWYGHRIQYKWRRLKQAIRGEWVMSSGQTFRPGSRRSERAKKIALDFIDREFADRPDLKEHVTPRYAFAGKRRVLSDDYYSALKRDNVRLIPHAVERITPSGLIDKTGTEHQADVIVIATGFTAEQYLASVDVFGVSGKPLRDTWGDSPFALLGLTVPGQPNFYIMYGPNTNGGYSICVNLEMQAKFIVKDLRRLARHPDTALAVKPRFVDSYNRWVQRRLANTAWATSNNYMKSPSGKIVTQWPEGSTLYKLMLVTLRRPSTITIRHGKANRRSGAAFTSPGN
jgi:cation diffusion facilitator CzcD-associated flavoprotein CzcO